MENQSELFLSVLSRFIESFSPQFNVIVNNFEEKNAQQKNQISVQKLFNTFPRNLTLYKSMVKSLADLSKCNPTLIIHKLIDLYTKAFTTSELSVFQLLITSSPTFTQTNSQINEICLNFVLFLTTDILSKIVRRYGTGDQGVLIINCAYKMCDSTIKTFVHPSLLQEWSNILSITSLSNLVDAASPFLSVIADDCNERIFTLVSNLRLDANAEFGATFLEEIVNILKNMQKKKTLTNTILLCVSSLISTVNFPCDALQKIFDIVWSEREDSPLKNGTFDLIVQLFQHLPGTTAKAQYFFKHRVLAHAGDEKKTERSLKLFWKKIIGGYLPLSFEEELNFISVTGDDAASQLPIFMEVFFKKSDFRVCPQLFGKVLLHLASIDFTYFLREMLPKFVVLPMKDPKIAVLLSIIKPLNSKNFRDKAISKITKDDIDALNAIVRGKVCQNLNIIEHKQRKKYCVTHLDDTLFRQIEQSDQKVAHFLEASSIEKFGAMSIPFNESVSGEKFSIVVSLLESMQYILDPSDFEQQNSLIKNILSLCSSFISQVAEAANELISYLISIESLQLTILKTLLNLLSDLQEPESMYCCVLVLVHLLSKQPKCLTPNLLHDIEITAFIGLVSSQPVTRIIAYRLLCIVDDFLNHQGAISMIHPNISIMDRCVKQRLLGKNISKEQLTFQSVLSSHFYDIWLLYLTELLDILIAGNYTPLLCRFNDSLSAHISEIKSPNYKSSPEAIGIIMIFLSSHINEEIYSKSTQIYTPQLFEQRTSQIFQFNRVQNDSENKTSPGSENSSEMNSSSNFGSVCIGLLGELLNGSQSWHDQLAFSVIQHLNISLVGEIADLLTSCSLEQMPDASTALLTLMNSPAMNEDVIESIRKPCISFLAALHSYLLKVNANSARVVTWTPELERNVVKSLVVAENYCILIEKIIPRSINEMDWSVSSRELVLRCLLNWATTESPVLQQLRQKVTSALTHLTRAGPMFIDSLIFDNRVCTTFAQIEASGNRVLSSLLFYHVQLVLLQYCEACLTSVRPYADLFFDALFVIFTAGSDFIPQQVGCLLLVGLVYQELQHPRAQEFMEAFQSSVYDGFGGATEMVFSEALRILKIKCIHMPVKEIILALRKFIKEIRLLPKQAVCTVDSPERFRVYTPYQFLCALMEATEQIDDDYFVSMTLLWRDLLNNSDHSDIVPLFIMQWENADSKKKLLTALIKQDAPYIIEKLVARCSFLYFVHITEQGKNFINELWVIEILTTAFERRSGSITNVAALAHFAFLFYNVKETQPLLHALCKQFDVPLPTSSHDDDLLVTVIAFVQKMLEDGDENLEEWGTEALKWLFGSENIKYCTLSLKIYNLICKPLNETVISGMTKVITFHVENNESDTSVLTDLISESFRFFSNIFTGNEMLSFSFASAFLDCPEFSDNCRAASTDIFLKSLNSTVTNKNAWAVLPSILRPLLSNIENDERSRQILEILIRTSNSEELMMIAAPLREVYGGFPSCKPSYILVEHASQTTLCKAIEHYALMIERASEQLAESIFKIAAVSVEKAANENVRDSLSRLYKSALNMLGVCPSAMKFILSIAEHDPGAATKSIFAFVDWARSVEDVERALNRLVKSSATVTTISDTSPLSSFEGIIGSDYTPKILPFATQQEIIEGMMRVQPTRHRRRGYSIRRLDFQGLRKTEVAAAVDWELKPLTPPTHLCGNLQMGTDYGTLILSDVEFNAAY